MKGASNFSDPGEIDLQAFLAGNDVMLMSNDVTQGIAALEKAVRLGVISEDRLAHSVKKILKYKYKAGLNNYCPIEFENLYADLNKQEYRTLNLEMFESAITVLKNEDDIIPIKRLDKEKIAFVKIGDGEIGEITKLVHKKSFEFINSCPQLL